LPQTENFSERIVGRRVVEKHHVDVIPLRQSLDDREKATEEQPYHSCLVIAGAENR
jgi:hypothetical protein